MFAADFLKHVISVIGHKSACTVNRLNNNKHLLTVPEGNSREVQIWIPIPLPLP